MEIYLPIQRTNLMLGKQRLRTRGIRKKNDISHEAVGFSVNRIAILTVFIVNLKLYVV
jgi:hypothetical protein